VPLAAAELHDLRERTTSFAGIGAIWSNTTMITGESPVELRIGLVTTDFFDVLGAGAAYGRTLTAADEGAAPTMVLSHALWQRRFGGDPRASAARSASATGSAPSSASCPGSAR
jgi:hypothetical protein